MTKTRSTKRALLMSGLALLICISMLIGSTFAWFTDSVTSAGNIIKSGTLDVTMEWADGTKAVPAVDSTDWTDASQGAIFDYELWEPGYVSVRHIKIANEGTLALKYQLNIIANGEVSKLADVIDVYYVDPAVQVADRTALTDNNKLGTLSAVLEQINTTASGNLKAKENHTITLALKMRESAGNEYQDLAIGSDFSIQLLATQLTSEFDSFNDRYDVEATYLNKDADGAWLINNLDELFFFAGDVNSGNSYLGETVKLTADIDLAGYNWVPIGSGSVIVDGKETWVGFNGAFDGQNHTISNVKITKGGGWNGIFGLVGRGTSKFEESISNLTVKNIVIEEANRMTAGVVGQLYGNIENCHVENVTINAIPNMTNKGEYDNGDKIGGVIGWFGDNGNNHYIRNCTAKNVTLKAYRDVAGIVGYIGTTSTVENCSVDTVSVTIDQSTNHYGVKDANAGGVVGRIYNQPVTVQNNTEANVTLNIPTYVSKAAELVAAINVANASAEDATIVLVNDIEISASNRLNNSNVTITIDGNGFSLLPAADFPTGRSVLEIDTKTVLNNLSIKGFDTTGTDVIVVKAACDITINGGVIANNTSRTTVTIASNYAAKAAFNGVRFENNTDTRGVIYNGSSKAGSDFTITDCTFVGNDTKGVAVINIGGDMNTITGNAFTGNTVTAAGSYVAGGIYSWSQDSKITDNTFSGNTVKITGTGAVASAVIATERGNNIELSNNVDSGSRVERRADADSAYAVDTSAEAIYIRNVS